MRWRNIIISVDRVEGRFVICTDENEFSFNLPLKYFNTAPHEGDMFNVIITPMPAKKQTETTEIISILDKLKKRRKY